MKKEGQVTIFIILAIFIIGIIMLLFLIPKNIEKPPELNVNKVHSYIYSLIENKAFECLQQIGEQGGYYRIPNQVYVNETAYWYYGGVNTQPFLDTIENQIAACIDEILKNSTNELLEIFGNNSLKINEERIKSKVRIGEWSAAINIYYPIAVSKGDSTSWISNFEVDYKINFLKLYEFATGIVNYASIPEFDTCNPSKNCYGEEINFSFFNEGDNLFIKGQTFVVFSNESREEPYELRFAIKRPIKEAFGNEKKKLAVLYQNSEQLPTFGGLAASILKNQLEITEGTDYYDCDEVPGFISKIDNYDIVIITGDLQYQIVSHTIWSSINKKNTEENSELPISSAGEKLLYGCNSFNNALRKEALKNWVNKGGILWINDVTKSETDNFILSYLGYLGYQGGKWESLEGSSLSEMQKNLIKAYKENKHIISYYDISQPDNYILTCPNDISKEISSTWVSKGLKVTNQDEIILGNKANALLWSRQIGKGFVVFDEFLLKDNLYNRLEFNDDLYSKGLAEKYFVNVLNYLAKFKEYKKAELEISLISPLNSANIEIPIFYFQSEFGKNASYNLLITDKTGATKSLSLESQDIEEQRFYKDRFKVDLTNKSEWKNLNEERYEWQIKMNESFSDIGSFIKKIPVQINKTLWGNGTNGNSAI